MNITKIVITYEHINKNNKINNKDIKNKIKATKNIKH